MTQLITTVTIVWISLPLFLGFLLYLLPVLDRSLTLAMAVLSAVYGLHQILADSPIDLQLIDSFGVTLLVNSLSGYFILTNALVTAAVVLYCWGDQGLDKAGQKRPRKTAFFFAQLVILHGCVNAVFICADFMSLYVALEVVGITAFSLVAYPRTDRTIWLALRYLMTSNTAMLFYLLGAVLVYQANHSFAFVGLSNAPKDAIALIFLGLLTKGGVFISGLWLPATHAEAEAPVSALLSGIVSKTGVFPLVRCALLVEEIAPIVQIFSIGTAVLGVVGAMLEKDTKRMLAFSTISQMGLVLAAPMVAGFYALTHGLAKAVLFLSAGNLSDRSFDALRKKPMPRSLWIVIAVASLSLSGFPLIAGFNAKIQTLGQLQGWPLIVLNTAAVGTAIVFAKFIFLPFSNTSTELLPISAEGAILLSPQKARPALFPSLFVGYWLAAGLLLSVLLIAGTFYIEDYQLANLLKALGKVGLGWLIYAIALRGPLNLARIRLPRAPERLDHLMGGMSLILVLLFWRVLA